MDERRGRDSGRRFGGTLAERSEHSCKHPTVERVDAVPIEKPGQPRRIEYRRLADPRAVCGGLDLEFEPCTSGKSHLGREPKPAIGLVGFDTPEVHVIAHAELLAVRPSSPQSGAANEQIDEAAKAPEPIGIVPA